MTMEKVNLIMIILHNDLHLYTYIYIYIVNAENTKIKQESGNTSSPVSLIFNLILFL